MTAWHRRDMLLISLRMFSWGMALHSSNNASSNSWSVWGWCCRLRRRLPIKSQRCSIQFRSGLRGGQSMTWIPESSRKREVTLEVCALAPSCINTKSGPISCAKGRYGSAQLLQHTSRLWSSPGWKWGQSCYSRKFLPKPSVILCHSNSLQQVRRQISFSSMPPHPDTTIYPRKQESLFIRKHYCGPI